MSCIRPDPGKNWISNHLVYVLNCVTTTTCRPTPVRVWLAASSRVDGLCATEHVHHVQQLHVRRAVRGRVTEDVLWGVVLPGADRGVQPEHRSHVARRVLYVLRTPAQDRRAGGRGTGTPVPGGHGRFGARRRPHAVAGVCAVLARRPVRVPDRHAVLRSHHTHDRCLSVLVQQHGPGDLSCRVLK